MTDIDLPIELTRTAFWIVVIHPVVLAFFLWPMIYAKSPDW